MNQNTLLNQRTTLAHIPQLHLEQAALDELDPLLLRQYRSIEGFDEAVQKLRAENQNFLSEEETKAASRLEFLAKLGQQKAAQRKTQNKVILLRTFAWAIPAAAAAVFALVLGLGGLANVGMLASGAQDDITRPKGDEQVQRYGSRAPATRSQLTSQGLELWQRTNDGQAKLLASGSKVAAYENVQIAYHSGGAGYGMIVSFDGNGKLTLHYPESFDGSTELTQAEGVVLPYAYQLDDAPNFERFYFITSEKEFSVRELWTRIESSLSAQFSADRSKVREAQPALGTGFDVSSFLVVK